MVCGWCPKCQQHRLLPTFTSSTQIPKIECGCKMPATLNAMISDDVVAAVDLGRAYDRRVREVERELLQNGLDGEPVDTSHLLVTLSAAVGNALGAWLNNDNKAFLGFLIRAAGICRHLAVSRDEFEAQAHLQRQDEDAP